MRILTCVGDATCVHTHGGLPYHLLHAGKQAGFIDAGWPLQPEKLRTARLIWNAGRLLTRGEFGGYQYTERFTRALVLQAPSAWSKPDEIISIFPLLPPARFRCDKVSIYIDATLTQNFEDYGIGKTVGRTTVADALKRERQAYRDAVHVLCRSRAAARSVVEDYGIDARKVHIVPGGANIAGDIEPSRYDRYNLPLTPVRLAFIGKDWRRKNLPFLLKVAETLHARGTAVEVIAAGFDPGVGPRHPRLRPIGFIDKRSDLETFIDLLRSCHFNCLFSLAEAFGLSNRESLRLGVPVLASDVGGIPDTVPKGCGHLFPPNAEAGDVADVIDTYVRSPDLYWSLRDHVASRADEFTWAAVVEKMQAIWQGSDAFSYRPAGATHG